MADLQTMRHSAAHIMAEAVQALFPGTKFAIGPAIEEGFYYDFDVPRSLTPEDLPRIEGKMAEIIKANHPFVCREMSREEAIKFFSERGQPFKVELLEEMEPQSRVSIYEQGGFIDLCRGPHVGTTGEIKAFKLLSIAGAYWRGDEKRPMLQRIYGTAFFSQSDLEAYLHKLAEAARRDHRRLGKELDLFSVQEEVGAGLVLWHPKGAMIREIVEDFWRKEHHRRGYDIAYTPHIARIDMWKTTGHYDWYRENMYSPMEIDEQQYMLKPMNCPFHFAIYKSKLRSYRDLPLRLAELGTVYRYERSGVLHGMLRVRGFTQDDAHIFARPDQLEDELLGVMDLAEYMMRVFGYQEYEVELSVRDPENKAKYVGREEAWEHAEAALESALKRKGVPYKRMEGEAKFYGPAIDIKLLDALGRAWQGPTIQVDFNLAERCDLIYIGDDGAQHRPVMVHRTVLGSMERFIAGLVEHYAGAFPVWLAPVQAVIIPIADRHLDFAQSVANRLRQADLRVEVDGRREKVNYKIREAQLQKIPYMLVVGDKEVDTDAVSVRLRTNENIGPREVQEFISTAKALAEAKSFDLWVE
ncbi:MAG: threonine--tRNA ligase [Chloroflexota bacterium]